MTTTYQERQKSKNDCLNSMLYNVVEFGRPRQLTRDEITEAYTECLDRLANHYTNLSEALSELYVAMTEHKTFPRHFVNVPMSQADSIRFERSEGYGGIATGFNRFQGWSRKHHEVFRKSQTRQTAVSRNKGLTNEQIVKFIKLLRKNHPLQEDITIYVYPNHGFIELGDKQLNGRVCREKGCSDVHIQVNTDQHVRLIYKTLAHEYRHIMQWDNSDLDWYTPSSKNKSVEFDAQMFAQRIINDYCYPKRQN